MGLWSPSSIQKSRKEWFPGENALFGAGIREDTVVTAALKPESQGQTCKYALALLQQFITGNNCQHTWCLYHTDVPGCTMNAVCVQQYIYSKYSSGSALQNSIWWWLRSVTIYSFMQLFATKEIRENWPLLKVKMFDYELWKDYLNILTQARYPSKKALRIFCFLGLIFTYHKFAEENLLRIIAYWLL